MAWEMDQAQTWGLWVAQTFFWQTLHAISFIFGCPLPSCSIIFHSPIPFSGFSVSLVFCLWKERCRDWTLQPEFPVSLSSISAGLSQTLQFRVSMTDLTVQFIDVLQVILFEALYLAICIFALQRALRRKVRYLSFEKLSSGCCSEDRCLSATVYNQRVELGMNDIYKMFLFSFFLTIEKCVGELDIILYQERM